VSVQETIVAGCELCASDGGTVIWRDAQLRVVSVDDADYPGFVRVIWNAHVREFSDLPHDARGRLMQAVLLVETAVRKALNPHKVNLASLGNAVPHLHWHVIARFADDPHFPQPIWGARQRDCPLDHLLSRRAAAQGLAARIVAAFSDARLQASL
jgi:diadenosine tetraphosphate (Ap4A) HIT family hydrolase